jgi:hypothetical protein
MEKKNEEGGRRRRVFSNCKYTPWHTIFKPLKSMKRYSKPHILSTSKNSGSPL